MILPRKGVLELLRLLQIQEDVRLVVVLGGNDFHAVTPEFTFSVKAGRRQVSR